MSNKRILIMAGGTGGHVFPGLALAEEMRQREFSVDWLGTEAGIEVKLVPAANIPLHFIPVRGVRGKGIKSVFMAPWNILASVMSAMSIIKSLKPQVVVGLGGFVAGPGGVAAKLLGIPLVIHEQNAVAGTTNRLLSKIASKVLTAFPNQLRAECIGNPVRKEIEGIKSPEDRIRIEDKSVKLLIVGGSRGALAINELLPKALGIANLNNIEIRHQAGAGKEEDTLALYENLNVEATVSAFIDDMAEALAWADIAVCRAGALTVSELSAFGLGAILIPFPYAIDDHQTENAKYLADAGAAIIKQQSELTEENLAELLVKLLSDKKQLLDMAIKAKNVGKLNVAQTFANRCEELVHV